MKRALVWLLWAGRRSGLRDQDTALLMRADSSGVGCHNDAYEGRWGTAHPPANPPQHVHPDSKVSVRLDVLEAKSITLKQTPFAPALAPGPPVLLVPL